MSQQWCTPCQINYLKNNFTSFTNWTSKNKEIDDLIQEMQLKINQQNDAVVEWIPFDQFKNIKRIDGDDLTATYLAVWKNGPLCYDDNYDNMGWKRDRNKNVVLKYLYNSQN